MAWWISLSNASNGVVRVDVASPDLSMVDRKAALSPRMDTPLRFAKEARVGELSRILRRGVCVPERRGKDEREVDLGVFVSFLPAPHLLRRSLFSSDEGRRKSSLKTKV